jgi:hypothetical protein
MINDKDKLIFNDDELTSLIEKHTGTQPCTVNITGYSSKFKIGVCNCEGDTALRDISLVSGYDANGVYKIDEMSGTIYRDEANPLDTGVAFVDGDTINVKYWDVCFPELMRELCNIIRQSSSKLTTIQSIAGLSINTSMLADQYWKDACYWGSKTCCD